MVKNRNKRRYPTINNLTYEINSKPLQLAIGKKFIYEDVILEVVKDNNQTDTCKDCFFECIRCTNLACRRSERKYRTSVHFKKVK